MKLRRSFTLLEVIIVIGIIGLLSSYVWTAVNQAREKARIAKARATVKQIHQAVSLMEDDTGEWPGHKTIEDVESGGSGNELWDLTGGDAGIVQTDGLFTNWHGPYLDRIPPDPWGNNYFFDTDYDIDPTAGEQWAAAIGSFGPNGVGQNVYDADNIYDPLSAE